MPDTSLPPAAPELATAGDDLLALLERRRSLPPLLLGEPGPGPASLRRMLTIASRVPDHGRLVPWRFILFEGEARAAFGQRIAPIFTAWLDTERAEWSQADANRRATAIDTMTRIFTRAPLVVIVVDRADPAARIPAWEQSLTVGAVCMNLINAAAGLGFASIWLSGWLATQKAAWPLLGLSGNERVAGVIHIGTAREAPTERERPDLDTITSHWQAA